VLLEARKNAVHGHSLGLEREARRGGWGAAAFLILSALTAYGSLLPFDFHIERLGVVRLTLAETGAADIQTNLLVYAPIGASLALFLTRRGFGKFAAILAAVLGGSALSLALESAQTLLPSRVASWTDVLLNATGSLLGGVTALLIASTGGAMLREIRRERTERPFTLAASLLTIGLLVYHILPCDFVTTTSQLRQAFARAEWNPLSIPTTTVAEALRQFVGDLSCATWFLLLGGLRGLAGLEAGRRPLISVGSAIKRGFALIVTIECLQLFTQSHVAQTNSVVMETMALTLGAWSGAFVLGDPQALTPQERVSPRLVWVPVVCALIFVQVTLLLLPGMNCWTEGTWSWASVGRLRLPFDALWRQPGLHGLLSALGTVVTYATLSASVSVLLMRTAIRRAGLLTALVVLGVAALSETLRAGSGFGTADVTALPLALLGVGLSSRVIDLLTEVPVSTA